MKSADHFCSNPANHRQILSEVRGSIASTIFLAFEFSNTAIQQYKLHLDQLVIQKVLSSA